MKYGDQLRQHSVPEWAYYNVDYDAVKQIIKQCTSTGKGKAIDVPGQEADAVAAGERRLYNVLLSEHERIALFVKSTSNEIQGRLANLERSFKRLHARSVALNEDGLSPYLLQRFLKLEREALTTGEQIRSLSRFIAAQRTGFRKLLKKYKKWSGSAALVERFRTEVLNRPSSFTNISLANDFARWTNLLHGIRATRTSGRSIMNVLQSPQDVSSAGINPPRKLKTRSEDVGRQFAQAIESMNDVNFDTAFSELPTGEKGARAVYWVHTEQLIELQVLLLQHLRLYITKPTSGTPSSLSQSPVVTRRSSGSLTGPGQLAREKDSGVIYIDDSEDYGHRQSRAIVGDSEEGSGSSSTRACVAVRWSTFADDALVSIRPRKTFRKQGTARVRRKHLGAFLDVERDFKPWKTAGYGTPDDGLDPVLPTSLDADDVRTMLEQRKELEPLVAILSKRTRFIGLSNTDSAGQWATLDEQISFCKVNRTDLAGKDWISNLARSSVDFPFAVLRVRQDGPCSKDLIEVLDQSHLTERVRGFSLASHAVWQCCKPQSMIAPFWLPAMEKDIRKLPELANLGRRRFSGIGTTEHGENSSASSNSEYDKSGSSTAVAADSSATSAPTTPMLERDFSKGLQTIPERKQKRVTLDEEAFIKSSRQKRREQARYWNEYDNPDSDDDANAYYIYIDPDAEDKWLGQETVERLYGKFRSLFSRKQSEPAVDEERGLIRPMTSYEDESDFSQTDSEPDSPKKKAKLSFVPRTRSRETSYGTIRASSANRRPSARLADLLLPPVDVEIAPSATARLLISRLSLAAATILSILIWTLATTGRKKQRGEVDAGVLLGIVASLCFALIGLTSMLTAKEKMGLINWVIIGSLFCTVCLADGVLVGWVLV